MCSHAVDRRQCLVPSLSDCHKSMLDSFFKRLFFTWSWCPTDRGSWRGLNGSVSSAPFSDRNFAGRVDAGLDFPTVEWRRRQHERWRRTCCTDPEIKQNTVISSCSDRTEDLRLPDNLSKWLGRQVLRSFHVTCCSQSDTTVWHGSVFGTVLFVHTALPALEVAVSVLGLAWHFHRCTSWCTALAAVERN